MLLFWAPARSLGEELLAVVMELGRVCKKVCGASCLPQVSPPATVSELFVRIRSCCRVF